MTPAEPASARALSSGSLLLRVLVALASAAALAAGLVVVVLSPRADAVVPLSPAFHGLAEGLDSSSWQHPHGAGVDWHAAGAAGQTFAFIKATEGTGPANRYYEADVEQARAAGMAVGSYHKARPAMDPVGQAQAFATRLQSVGGPQLPPVLDIEVDEGKNPQELIDWTRTFLTELERLTGRAPIIYTYRYFWIDRMGNTPLFAEYPLWLAEYGVHEPTQPMIGGWSQWLFWQRADNGRVPGFAGDVDLNVFAGTRDDLAGWLGPVDPQAPPAPAPAPEAAPAPAPEAPPAPAPGAAPLLDPAPQPVPGPAPVAAPAEAITVPIPQNLPTPDGVRLPESIEVPAELVERVLPVG